MGKGEKSQIKAKEIDKVCIYQCQSKELKPGIQAKFLFMEEQCWAFLLNCTWYYSCTLVSFSKKKLKYWCSWKGGGVKQAPKCTVRRHLRLPFRAGHRCGICFHWWIWLWTGLGRATLHMGSQKNLVLCLPAGSSVDESGLRWASLQ